MSAQVIQLPRTAGGRELYRKHVRERRAQGLEPSTGGDHFDRWAAWLADPQGRDFWREEVQRDIDASPYPPPLGWRKSPPAENDLVPLSRDVLMREPPPGRGGR